MYTDQLALLIEIPSNVVQQEIWDVEEKLGQVEGVKPELQEPRDLIAATMLILHFSAPIFGQIAEIGSGVKAFHEVAEIIYEFLHPVKKENTHAQGKNKVVIISKGKRIELYNLSTVEIEKVLKG